MIMSDISNQQSKLAGWGFNGNIIDFSWEFSLPCLMTPLRVYQVLLVFPTNKENDTVIFRGDMNNIFLGANIGENMYTPFFQQIRICLTWDGHPVV